MADIEKLLRAALDEIPRELYGAELEDGDLVGNLVSAIREALDDGDFEFAYEELESIGVEFDMTDDFRACLVRVVELMEA